MKIGEIRYNKFGTPMRIVDFTRHDDVTIEFLDLHNMKKKTTYSNFKNGGIKNPYDRNKIKTCLEYSPTDIKTNFNILSISYGELSKIVDLGPADNFDDILRILEKCYELKLAVDGGK